MDRHVILTLGRSGSNTLQDIFNQNPALLNYGEVLGEWNRVRKVQRRSGLFKGQDDKYLDAILTSRAFARMANLTRTFDRVRRRSLSDIKRVSDVRSIGIKEFSLNFKNYGLERYLLDRPDIKVVGLIRDGILERMISAARLGATGEVTSRNTSASGQRTFHLPPGEIVSRLAAVEDENRHLEQMLAELPAERVYVVKYDAFFSDAAERDRIVDEVFDFLGVPRIRTQTRMTKIIQTPPVQAIANIDQCRSAVRGTKYEGLFA